MPLIKHFFVTSTLLAFSISNLWADDTKTASRWKGDAELGSNWTSGNTDTKSISARLEVIYSANAWKYKLRLDALNSEDDGITSKEKYSGQLQFDRNFNEHSYLALILRQERDYFSGFAYQGTASASYGYRFVNNEELRLAMEVGPGYLRDRVEATGVIAEEAIARAALKLHWIIGDGVEFTQDFIAEMGDKNSVYKSDTGLKSLIIGSFATRIYYRVKHVDSVPVGTENTDTEFGVGFVYAF